MKAAKVEIYRDKAGTWRWRAKARNGLKVADSGEGYNHRVDAREAAEALFPQAEVVHLPEDA